MRFWASISLGLFMILAAFAQAPNSGPSRSSAVKPRKVNELTLAALRPGRDFAVRAVQLFGKPGGQTPSDQEQLVWSDPCRKETLTLDLDAEKRIQVIRASGPEKLAESCERARPSSWKTGRGLRVWDPAQRVVQLYGEPDSRSPSTKDGRKLELLYYAFDWAGTDVPQVMEVLCTVEHDSNSGRVVEITLAAPSL
jgi:hypothetical protein